MLVRDELLRRLKQHQLVLHASSAGSTCQPQVVIAVALDIASWPDPDHHWIIWRSSLISIETGWSE